MFETEVKFAADCIRATNDGPGLVLFDELFHSTNPPDAARSAELFLKQLWASDTYSVVSTHVFPLVEGRPEGVQAICCAASEVNGEVVYSYRAEPGICKVSSVHKVWKKYGLVPRKRGT
jgi:DNA mismatch repair ATPase MutS